MCCTFLVCSIENWKPNRVAIEDIQLQKFTGKTGHSEAAVTTYKSTSISVIKNSDNFFCISALVSGIIL